MCGHDDRRVTGGRTSSFWHGLLDQGTQAVRDSGFGRLCQKVRNLQLLHSLHLLMLACFFIWSIVAEPRHGRISTVLMYEFRLEQGQRVLHLRRYGALSPAPCKVYDAQNLRCIRSSCRTMLVYAWCYFATHVAGVRGGVSRTTRDSQTLQPRSTFATLSILGVRQSHATHR